MDYTTYKQQIATLAVVPQDDVNFNIILPLIKLLCPRSKVFLNIYGLEVWSSKNRVTKCFKYLLAGVISDCNNTANYFRIHMSYKSKLITIWDCVDHRVFYPDSDDTLESFPYVLSMGRLSWGAAHKGYIRLIDAFSELVKYSPHIKLIIAGDGDMKNHLVKYSRTILPPDSVYFPGYVTDRVYRKLLTNARVFSLVSESGQNAGEGLPLTPLEAMACGTPIVVGDQDGSKEAIQAKIGFAINPFDRSAHIKSLSYYLDMHPSEYLQLSALCRETSLKYFSYEQFSDKLYDALYY